MSIISGILQWLLVISIICKLCGVIFFDNISWWVLLAYPVYCFIKSMLVQFYLSAFGTQADFDRINSGRKFKFFEDKPGE